MSDTEPQDDTWEEFFGSSPDLMPSIMGAIDAILDKSTKVDNEQIGTSSPVKTYQANQFTNLSPNVQKILSNVTDQDLSRKFSSEEAISTPRKLSRGWSQKSTEKTHHKSTESLEVISPGVQKMLSNLPDSELVISASNLHNGDARVSRNNSFLYTATPRNGSVSGADCSEDNKPCATSKCYKSFLYQASEGAPSVCDRLCAVDSVSDSKVCTYVNGDTPDSCPSKPLGSYLHTSPSGITSRMPVGRKNMGKFLQVPSESSVGTNSTASSEVSRPVSLTSLGSCSSSGSSGPHQVGSAYLASAESLDSDPEPNGSQGSADSGIADQSPVSPEMRVLQEVMDTEAVYVTDLGEVIEGYLLPWRNDPESPLRQYLEHLFSNLEQIYEFNKSFLNQLRVSCYDPTHVANVFLHNDSGFSVYTEYCTNYPKTMEVLGELTRDDKIAALFQEQQRKLHHALPLGSYLLKPVQRILKYHLLLQRLSKQCDTKHKPAVDLALTTMTGIASHINTMKRKHEHAVRVQEIQAQLYGWSGPALTALGELIAEGTFRVSGARGRRHVFLFDKVLLMAKSKQDGSLAYKTHINCSNLMLVEQVRGEPLSFHVLPFDNPRLQCTLRARSPQHKREWTLQIKRVILENYSAVIPNHARQLVMQLGQEIPDSEDTSENWPPLKQHSTPQYLERRSRFRKTRELPSRRAASQDRSLVSLGSWRRKSEPSMIPQYNAKTMPKKISNIKKAKESSAKFYTDLSDSENCDAADESNNSLETNSEQNDTSITRDDTYEDIQESSLEDDSSAKNTLEKVVSDLLMQNKEFQKVFNRRRNIRESEPLASIWLKQEQKLPTKADSLPRNIQLNDQIDNANDSPKLDDELMKNEKTADVEEEEEEHDMDISSQINESDKHPEHRIYRKSAIRFSLLQRFRAIISEEQKRSDKLPTYKQGSKNMGEKIANPDYADPLKLFSNSCSSSMNNLNMQEMEKCDNLEIDLMGEPEVLDMTINEKDVLKEIDERLKESSKATVDKPVSDTGQRVLKSSQNNCGEPHATNNKSESKIFNSSQNSDNYYESVMERNLNQENSVQVDNHKICGSTLSENNKSRTVRPVVKRPTKAPPPIPVKPKGLSSISNEKIKSSLQISHEINRSRIVTVKSSTYTNGTSKCENLIETNSKSWVKTMVGRFE